MNLGAVEHFFMKIWFATLCESNFDEKSVHLLRGLFVIEVTSYKIHTLKLRQYVHKKIRLDSASVTNS